MADMAEWMQALPTGILCTFQNFLHGTALLPQLFLTRQRCFLARAEARFLLILGVKHIAELGLDVWVSIDDFMADRLDRHDVSFLSGDLFAAVILLDFLYLIVIQARKRVFGGELHEI